MRLLNARTFLLRDFQDPFPEYAILSHTWGKEEVLFEDIQKPQTDWRRKNGSKKVTGFCELAKVDGYEWVWIDSCCIDKSSSAELSEAINSMFKWYQSSVVCYVYLTDVSGRSQQHPFKLFPDSRWFKRGWT